MCGRTYARQGARATLQQVRGPFGLDVEKMSPRARIAVGLSVLGLVAVSGVFLALTPVWWIFTTYFWVAFPALGLLGSGIAGFKEGETIRVSDEAKERELLEALRDHGEVTPAGAASETSLTVDEAEQRLKILVEGGHLQVRVQGGGLFYALWDAEGRIAGVK
jgi:hypothetical protein